MSFSIYCFVLFIVSPVLSFRHYSLKQYCQEWGCKQPPSLLKRKAHNQQAWNNSLLMRKLVVWENLYSSVTLKGLFPDSWSNFERSSLSNCTLQKWSLPLSGKDKVLILRWADMDKVLIILKFVIFSILVAAVWLMFSIYTHCDLSFSTERGD